MRGTVAKNSDPIGKLYRDGHMSVSRKANYPVLFSFFGEGEEGELSSELAP